MPVTPSTTGYADAELLLSTWLTTVLGYENVTHEIPSNLPYHLPCIVVERFGGADSVLSLDVANVDVDVYGPDRVAALAHAETIRQALRRRLPGYQHNGVAVGKVETLSAPTHATWDSKASVRRFTAAYRIHLRKYTGV